MIHLSAPGRQALSDAELKQLQGFLASRRHPGAFTLEGLDGFFCALIAGPDLVLPSEYLPIVLGDAPGEEDAFESLEAANTVLQLLMRHWNAIIAEFETDGVYEPLFDPADAKGVEGRAWARGFMRGVGLRKSGWSDLFTDENEGQLLTIPLVAGEVDPDFPPEPLPRETAEQLVVWMAAGLGRAYRHFKAARQAGPPSVRRVRDPQRRVAPKIGRNAPCPCGSGRKYKLCCGVAGERTTH